MSNFDISNIRTRSFLTAFNFSQKIPPTQSKWEIIRAMPKAHYCGKSVGNSSSKMAETIVNTGSLPLWRRFAVADE